MSIQIIFGLWAIASSLSFLSFAEDFRELKFLEMVVVGLVFVIGGPAFLLSGLLGGMLEYYFKEEEDE